MLFNFLVWFGGRRGGFMYGGCIWMDLDRVVISDTAIVNCGVGEWAIKYKN